MSNHASETLVPLSSEEKRFINFLRGIAIFLMLWGHCIQYCVKDHDFFEDPAFKTIYSFHMPLFMLISGFLFYYSAQKRDRDELLRYKTRSLLLPIVMCSLLNCILALIPTLIFSRSFSYKLLLDGNWLSKTKDLWFLWSVLSASIAMTFAAKTKTRLLEVFFLIAGVLICFILPNTTLSLYVYPYFILGYYYAKYHQKQNRRKLGKAGCWLLGAVLAVAFILMLSFFEKKHYIYTSGIFSNRYSLGSYLLIDGYRWLIGLIGCAFAVILCKGLFAFFQNGRIGNWFTGKFEETGKSSLQIYALSVVMLSNWLSKAVSFLERKGMSLKLPTILYDLVFTPLLATLYVIALTLIVKLIQKIKLSKYLFGR